MISRRIFELDVPILGICYGLQLFAWHFASVDIVALGEQHEYGHAKLNVKQGASVSRLFSGLGSELDIWMSHGKSGCEDPIIGLPNIKFR